MTTIRTYLCASDAVGAHVLSVALPMAAALVRLSSSARYHRCAGQRIALGVDCRLCMRPRHVAEAEAGDLEGVVDELASGACRRQGVSVG